jgi:hypothetical protein
MRLGVDFTPATRLMSDASVRQLGRLSDFGWSGTGGSAAYLTTRYVADPQTCAADRPDMSSMRPLSWLRRTAAGVPRRLIRRDRWTHRTTDRRVSESVSGRFRRGWECFVTNEKQMARSTTWPRVGAGMPRQDAGGLGQVMTPRPGPIIANISSRFAGDAVPGKTGKSSAAWSGRPGRGRPQLTAS